MPVSQEIVQNFFLEFENVIFQQKDIDEDIAEKARELLYNGYLIHAAALLNYDAFLDKEEVKFLLVVVDSNELINEVWGEDKMSPLHIAADMGHKETTEKLCGNKANINDKDRYGHTPLSLAVTGEHSQVVELLLQFNANPNIPDNIEKTPLHYTCERAIDSKENLKIFNFLVQNNAHLDAQDQDAATPLCLAALEGDLKIVEGLVQRGANLGLADAMGRTPLHCAFQEGNPEIAEYLLGQRANPALVDNDGNSPLHFAISKIKEKPAFEKLAIFLIEHCSSSAFLNIRDNIDLEAPIHLAAYEGHAEIVKILLKKNIDIFIPDLNGMTAEQIALEEGYTEIASLLREKPLSLENSTPLHMAVKQGNIDAVKEILEKGAEEQINKKEDNGLTPLALACILENYLIVEQLILHKADATISDGYHRNPLYYAILHTKYNPLCEQIAVLLIKELGSGSLNICDKREKLAPLYLAVTQGHLEIVKQLLRKGANVNFKAPGKITPLHCAVGSGNVEMVKILLENGAIVNAKNQQGASPLVYAAWVGHIDVIQILLKNRAEIDNKAIECAFKKNDLQLAKIFWVNVSPERYTAEDFFGMKIIENPEKPQETETWISRAAKNGEKEILEEIVNMVGSYILNVTDNNDDSPLHLACREGHEETAQFLIAESPCLLNQQNKQGKTPLFFAVENGHFDVVKRLLEKNADIYIPDNNGKTALQVALKKGYTEIVSLITSLLKQEKPCHKTKFFTNTEEERKSKKARNESAFETPVVTGLGGLAGIASNESERLDGAASSSASSFGSRN